MNKKRIDGKTSTKLLFIMLMIFIIISSFTVYADDNLTPPIPQEAVGADVDESNISIVYYVDGENEVADDRNPGTEQEPFKTIGRAVNLALDNYHKGQGTKILVSPGVYREGITMIGRGEDSSVPIILEGYGKGEVIVKGSVIFKEKWQEDGDCYKHPWVLSWGARDNIYEEEYDVHLDEIVRRREMIFVNGQLMEQVLDKDELTAGCFFVDEKEKMAYIMPPADTNMDEAVIEVAMYDRILQVRNLKNVAIRNLTFQHGNPYHPFDVFSIAHSTNVLVEDCEISWNNWFGLGLWTSSDITLNRVSSNNNGGGGFQGSGLDNILVKDCETSNNNWRGQTGSYYAWDTAGIKFLFAYKVKISGHKAIDNTTIGIWFDSECRDIIIEDCLVKGNTAPEKSIIAGLYLEGSLGPFLVDRCTVLDNWRGINIASSNDVYIKDTIIANNETDQINLFNNWGHGRTFKSRFSDEDVTSFAVDTIMENTIISAPNNSAYPIYGYDHNDPGAYTRWYKTLTTKNVHYYHPKPDEAFLMQDIRTLGDFAQWQSFTGLDADAVWIPGPAAGLKLDKDESGKYLLSWEPSPSNIKGYKIFCNNEEIGDTDEVSFELGYPVSAGDFSYTVKAYDSEGNMSVASNHISISVDEHQDDSEDAGEQKHDENVNGEKKPKEINIVLISIIFVLLVLLVSVYILFSKPKNKK